MKSLLTVLHALWLGAHMFVGYVVAPVLFRYAEEGMFDKRVAGDMAGDLFEMVTYFGLFVGMVWYVLLRQQRLPSRLMGSIVALLALGQFLVTPVIVAIKQQQNHWLLDLVGGSFGVWHGTSSMLYLLVSMALLVFTWQKLAIKTTRF